MSNHPTTTARYPRLGHRVDLPFRLGPNPSGSASARPIDSSRYRRPTVARRRNYPTAIYHLVPVIYLLALGLGPGRYPDFVDLGYLFLAATARFVRPIAVPELPP